MADSGVSGCSWNWGEGGVGFVAVNVTPGRIGRMTAFPRAAMHVWQLFLGRLRQAHNEMRCTCVSLQKSY
jgi:hypothetical protein